MIETLPSESPRIEQAKKVKNKHLNDFLSLLNAWKDYVLNYFVHRFTTSAIEGINNTIKTAAIPGLLKNLYESMYYK